MDKNLTTNLVGRVVHYNGAAHDVVAVWVNKQDCIKILVAPSEGGLCFEVEAFRTVLCPVKARTK
jgi:hypothetical protein